jgi:hypothetical protein
LKLHRSSDTFQEIVDLEPDVYKGGQSWGLMVMPFKIFDFIFKFAVVIESVADIDN